MAYTNERMIELDQESHDLTDELMQLSAVLDEAREKLKDEFEAVQEDLYGDGKRTLDYIALEKIDAYNKRMIAIKDTRLNILNLLRQIDAAYDRGAEDLDNTIHDAHCIERLDEVRSFVKNA